MRKSRAVYAAKGTATVLCWLLPVMVICVTVKILSSSALGERLESALNKLARSEKIAEAAVRFELGRRLEDREETDFAEGTKQMGDNTVGTTVEEFSGESSVPEYEETEEQAEASGVFLSGEYLDPAYVTVDNKTGLEADVESLLNSQLDFTVNLNEPTVLILHTHGSEAYTMSGEDTYTESDPYRTENNDYNVVRVGSELKSELEKYGINVIHDKTLHDYPSYNGSYNRSFETVAKYIEKYPSIKIVIDLHRDAIANADGTQYRTVAQVGDDVCSQLLLVMGTNASGLDHPAWQENMKLACKLQYAMNTMFPNLAKPIKMSEYRYNQHMTSGSMILEVGCAGNTLEESLNAVKYFAQAAAEVILSAAEKEN